MTRCCANNATVTKNPANNYKVIVSLVQQFFITQKITASGQEQCEEDTFFGHEAPAHYQTKMTSDKSKHAELSVPMLIQRYDTSHHLLPVPPHMTNSNSNKPNGIDRDVKRLWACNLSRDFSTLKINKSKILSRYIQATTCWTFLIGT